MRPAPLRSSSDSASALPAPLLGRFTTICSLIGLAAILATAGCAQSRLGTEPTSSRFMPQGPGAVFPTAEAAAMDALTYCFVESRRSVGSEMRMRGGSIHPVDGGFSYDEPIVARRATGAGMKYRLRPDDVAHYRHFPQRMHSEASTPSRRLSREDRRFVDRQDPAGRPFYYLTPQRRLRVYPGVVVGEQTLARVDPSVRRSVREVGLRTSVGVPRNMPLALRDQPLSASGPR